MDVKKALDELAKEVEKILRDRIEKYGYNEGAKKNTLVGSDLEKSIKVNPTEDGIALTIADYWWYVAKGWKRSGENKTTGLYHALVVWALKNHITVEGKSQNVSAVIFAENLWRAMIFGKYEIKGRPFMIPNKSGPDSGHLNEMLPELKTYIDKWFDRLFEAIMEDTTKYFNN